MKSTLSIAFSAILLALLITISCQKTNSDLPDDPDDQNPPPIEYVTASISGRVLDNNNQPVNGAVVKAGTTATTSDLNGHFKLNNVLLNKDAGLVKVEKDGFFLGSRTIVVNKGVVNYVSLQLIKKTVSGTVSGSTGGNITVSGGGSIVFTGNSFVNTAGNGAYAGTVSVSTFFINPAAANFNEIMPGTLRGITMSNEETALQSFGMMAVELNGAGGEKLQLASGKTATLTFPIPTALQAQAPAIIPLWSFNDTTGLWKEEGTAIKQGTNYVGTVGHFSFWNCDYPLSRVVDFKAVIKDQNGNALYPAQVIMKISTDSFSSVGYGYTDTTGMVSGKVPINKTIQLKIYGRCNQVIYSQNIGPFTSNIDMGVITITASAPSQVTVSGTVVNCTSAPVTNGFVDISIDSIHNRAAVTNGSFSITISRCSGTPTTAAITAYDVTGNQNGTATNVAVNSGTVNAGQLIACGISSSQFLNYTMNGATVSYVPPTDSLGLVGSGNNQYTIYARRSPNNGEQVSLSFTASGTGTVPVNYLNIFTSTNKVYSKQGTINLNITEFGPASGGYISGNFTGNVVDSFSAPISTNVVFRVRR
jgi:hypothetical protein